MKAKAKPRRKWSAAEEQRYQEFLAGMTELIAAFRQAQPKVRNKRSTATKR
jgi:hypothetical protein